MPGSEGFRIADAARVSSLLDGLARRIHGALGAEAHVVGILRRGAPLAREIGDRLSVLRGEELEVGTLELKRYADDLSLIHEKPELKGSDLPFDPEGASVILVDDVAYSGRTFLEAVGHLVAAGASEIHLCALCSRGENEVPVSTRFVGLQVDVGEGKLVEVHAPPYEDEWAVWLFHQEDVDAD